MYAAYNMPVPDFLLSAEKIAQRMLDERQPPGCGAADYTAVVQLPIDETTAKEGGGE